MKEIKAVKFEMTIPLKGLQRLSKELTFLAPTLKDVDYRKW